MSIEVEVKCDMCFAYESYIFRGRETVQAECNDWDGWFYFDDKILCETCYYESDEYKEELKKKDLLETKKMYATMKELDFDNTDR
jgi:hypothetical protein